MSDKSNKYGYVGVDIPEQSFGNNKGIFNPAEINELVADNKWTQYGQLELNETQTVSSAFADFESLGSYNVHLFTLNNVVPSSATNIGLRVSNDGGTSYEATGYQYAWQRGYPSTFTELKSTSSDRIQINGSIGTGTNDALNGYVYGYNLLDSSKYSFFTFHTIGSLSSSSIYALMSFGSGVKPTAETHNGVRFGTGSFSALTSGSISLYGIRYS